MAIFGKSSNAGPMVLTISAIMAAVAATAVVAAVAIRSSDHILILHTNAINYVVGMHCHVPDSEILMRLF